MDVPDSPFWTPHRTLAYVLILLIDLILIWFGLQLRTVQYPRQLNDSEKTKYILFWTPVEPIFHTFDDEGLNTFIENNCEYTNCIVTSKRRTLPDVTQFDAIVFSAYSSKLNTLPTLRSPHQKYIMASLESPAYFNSKSDLVNPMYFINNYFNWTWTYRLDSDVPWRYFVITDLNGKEVGPKINMQWLNNFKPVSKELKKKLMSKSKAAAWIVSNCVSWSQREIYAKKLIRALKKHNLTLDIYGKCAKKKCGKPAECASILERDYYFYLAFENAFDEDYVTEKVVRAVHSFTVPVVLGGANYTRFLPPGSYLDAKKLTPEKLSETMRELISNFTLYQEYFRWRSHYIYKKAHRSDTCNLCKALNDEKMVKKITVYPDMKTWWTGKQRNVDLEIKQKTSPPVFTKISV